jgi:hypothetical protein
MLFGGTDDDYEDEFDDKQDDVVFDTEGGCGGDQQPPPPSFHLDLDEIDGRMEEVPLLDMKSTPEQESKPILEQGTDKAPKKAKLASSDDTPRLAGRRDQVTGRSNRISGFHKRESRNSGGGQLLGGGSSGFAGFIG